MNLVDFLPYENNRIYFFHPTILHLFLQKNNLFTHRSTRFVSDNIYKYPFLYHFDEVEELYHFVESETDTTSR